MGNDCEVDSEVKKPLLHDLFDLLGLPVCNTGLSLFTIWAASNTDEEDESESDKIYFNKRLKRRCKISRDQMKIMQLCQDNRSLVIFQIKKKIFKNLK